VFNRFAASTRAAVVAAIAEASRRGDHRAGTEHLLLGLLHDDQSPAVRALGVDLDAARDALLAMDRDALVSVGIEVAPPPDEPAAARGHLPFTSGAKSVLQQTLREAVARKDRRLEPRHLLLALLGCRPPDPAAAVLSRLGVDPDVVRRRLDSAA
jgi:ATP-dependent Clp protease ATP-binding subunit ClpA